MRKVFDWLLLLISLSLAGYQWYTHRDQLLTTARLVRTKAFPCSTPITYSIGAIDLRYNISKEELAGDLKEAEAFWEGPAHRNFFDFKASSGDVTVSMVYDRRQEAMDTLKAMGMKTDQSLASYNSLKASYEALVAKVEPERAALDARLAAYKSKEAAYNAKVKMWNKRGNVSQPEFWRLKAAKSELAQQFADLKSSERGVNSDIDTLNALATTLNQLIVELNLNVEQYNREGSSIGSFEEGLYKVNKGIRSIDLYKYSDHNQLVRLLAHEMGHALGLEHVADPLALMYPVNKGDSLAIGTADIAELNRACTADLPSKIKHLPQFLRELRQKERTPPAVKPAGGPVGPR